MHRRLKLLLSILNGTRRRRWMDANAIHESHAWDAIERRCLRRRARARKLNDRLAAAYALEHARLNRVYYGVTWVGPRPGAP